MNKLRKWILRWLFQSDLEHYENSFQLANRLFEISQSLLERNEQIFAEYYEILRAIAEAPNIGILQLQVIGLLNKYKDGITNPPYDKDVDLTEDDGFCHKGEKREGENDNG